jgi:hypothetical protein
VVDYDGTLKVLGRLVEIDLDGGQGGLPPGLVEDFGEGMLGEVRRRS